MTKDFHSDLSKYLTDWEIISASDREIFVQNIYVGLANKKYPFFKNETEVILFYRGDEEKVECLSDITGWTDPICFSDLPGTDLFYLKLDLEPDARIQYLLIVDGKAIPDPSNKFKSRDGVGYMSELAMPEYKLHPYFEGFLQGEEADFKGLIKHTLPPGVLPYEHEVFVAIPSNYSISQKYPVIYFQDGPDYIRYGLAVQSINKLTSEDLIQPCIAVFVTPPNLHKPLEPNRSTEYGLNNDYVKFFCDELVPFIDSTYRTEESPEKRLVIGDSYAGLISIYLAVSRPDLFRNAYSQSGFLSFKNNRIIDIIKNGNILPINLFLDIGTYEFKVGADFIPKDEQDFTKANRKMCDVLTSKEYSFIFKEYHEGHTWGNWRRHLIDALIYFFGKNGVEQ